MSTETTGPFDLPPAAAHRPTTPSPDYGVPPHGGEMVSWSHVVDRLTAASAYWLATTGPGGRPHVVPVWGALLQGHLFLETGGGGTAKVRHLEANPAVAVHLPDPEDVVLIRGTAAPARPDRALGARLAEVMSAKYAGYDPAPDSWDGGGLHVVLPERVLAWRDMPTATRWLFPDHEQYTTTGGVLG